MSHSMAKQKFRIPEIKELRKLSKPRSINPKYRKLRKRKLVFYILFSRLDIKLKVAVCWANNVD